MWGVCILLLRNNIICAWNYSIVYDLILLTILLFLCVFFSFHLKIYKQFIYQIAHFVLRVPMISYSNGFFLILQPYCSFTEFFSYFSQNRLNITKTVRKYSIDSRLNPTGSEFHSGQVTKAIKHDDEADEEYGEGSVSLNGHNFDRISHQ